MTCLSWLKNSDSSFIFNICFILQRVRNTPHFPPSQAHHSEANLKNPSQPNLAYVETLTGFLIASNWYQENDLKAGNQMRVSRKRWMKRSKTIVQGNGWKRYWKSIETKKKMVIIRPQVKVLFQLHPVSRHQIRTHHLQSPLLRINLLIQKWELLYAPSTQVIQRISR